MTELQQKDILQELEACVNEEDIQTFHVRYLGKKGLIPAQFKTLGQLNPEERKTKGKEIKDLQQNVEKAFFAKQDIIKQNIRNKRLQNDLVDISLL